jgi:hypothetical protein
MDSSTSDIGVNHSQIKNISIIPSDYSKQKSNSKNIHYEKEKEKKMRVETKTWGLNDNELSHEMQYTFLKDIFNSSNTDTNINAINAINAIDAISDSNKEENKYISQLTTHIKTKIGGYRQQDIIKKRLNTVNFVGFEEVVRLLNNCEMKCDYCSEEVYILYERVREMKQWSLDRINNDIGHNNGNLVVACLECNLKRRRTNKDAFMFTKNLVITREGL